MRHCNKEKYNNKIILFYNIEMTEQRIKYYQ